MNQEQDIQARLDRFYNDTENSVLINKYLSETFFEVIGKAHNETVHSNFLAWYFKQPSWALNAIRQMIGLAKEYSSTSSIGYKNLISDFEKQGSYTISGIEVKRECKCVVKANMKKRRGSVDIVISCELQLENNIVPLKIIIENKVDSHDHDHQTFIYYTYFSNNESKCRRHGEVFTPYQIKHKYIPKKNEIQLFFYLSPSCNNGDINSSCICDSFIRITYQDLYEKVVIPDVMQKPNEANKRGALFVEEYRKNLLKPYMDKQNNIRIMAYDKNDIKRLKKFWNDNLPLFKLAATAICQSTDDSETKERIEAVIQSIDSIGKKHSLYNLTLPNGVCYKNEGMKVIAKRVVEYLLDTNIKIKDINALLPKGIVPIIDTKGYKDKKRESTDSTFDKRRDKFNNKDLYLSNQWTTPRFEKFLSKLSDAYPEIRVEKATSFSEE